MNALTDEDIARALAEVLEPTPGNLVPIPAVHGAALAHLGVTRGASFRNIKDVLRAAGVRVASAEPGADHHAYDVALTPDAQSAELERQTRRLRRPSR